MATKIVEVLHLGREMREVVDSQRSFDAAHFVDHLLEAIVAEQLMLVFLEVFARASNSCLDTTLRSADH